MPPLSSGQGGKETVNNSTELFRYCTNVGVYEGYSKKEKAHIVTARMPDDVVNAGGQRFIRHYLDEYQFMVWLVCHATVISEDDMYEAASDLWYECDIQPKKPIIRSYRELREKKLLAMSQAEEKEVSLYEIGTQIQPYTISLSSSIFAQRSFRVLKNALWNTIKGNFLPKEEKKIFKFFSGNKGYTFFDYAKKEDIMENESYLAVGKSIKNLLQKGYMCPVGWCFMPSD